ncbi:MAG: mucoidy inhibitor MuiA family protein [Candidatus Stahlbacteria bacterium]|nr:mucoidy inhibitor MuiA family protein [Candidatus Stahlbacteria bacterium]
MLKVQKFIYFLLLLSVSATAATRKEIRSRITDVRIYSERALITRSVSVELLAGTYTLVFPNLPATLSDESIKLKSSALIRMGEIKIENVFLEEEQEPQIVEIKKEIEKLQMDSSAVEDAINVLHSKEKFLESIQVASSSAISKELGTAKISPSSWKEGLGFLVVEFVATKEKIREKMKEKEKIVNKLSVLREKLNNVWSEVAREKKNILVEAEVSGAGVHSIELSYILPGVSWLPYYEVRTVPQKDEIEVSYYGKIQQMTGEAWEEVTLALSTAQPIIGAQAPELMPWYVKEPAPGSAIRTIRSKGKRVKGEGYGDEENVDAMSLEMAQVPASVPIEAGVSTVFEIKGRKTIPSTSEPTNILIMRENLTPKFKYVTIPKLAERAYLQSKIKNETKYVFLGGQVSVFVGGDYVGKSGIKNIATDEEFELSLGVDDRIKVKRELVKKMKSEAGIFNKAEKMEYLYKITIKNYKNTAIAITVKDQLPISQDEKVKVSETELNPNPSKKEVNGIIEWGLTLEPQEEKEIKIGFAIEYPPGINIDIF